VLEASLNVLSPGGGIGVGALGRGLWGGGYANSQWAVRQCVISTSVLRTGNDDMIREIRRF